MVGPFVVLLFCARHLLHKWDNRSSKFKPVPTLLMKNEDSTPTLCLIPSNHTSTTKINNFPIAFGPNMAWKAFSSSHHVRNSEFMTQGGGGGVPWISQNERDVRHAKPAPFTH